MIRRGGLAAVVLAAWGVGLVLLTRRELFRGDEERLAQAAMLVAPGVEYYAVLDASSGKHVGFASSSVDTTLTGIEVKESFTALGQGANATERASVRTAALLTRGLRLRSFTYEVNPSSGGLRVAGRVINDSLLELVTASGVSAPDTQRFSVSAQLLVPSVVPLGIALGDKPKVGKSRRLSVFDPTIMAPVTVSVRLAAESLFVVSDSARFETGRWVSAHDDTVRAWRLEQEAGTGNTHLISGWVDSKGRLVETRELFGFALRRTAYEIATRNVSAAFANG
ncbi:MAG: hypothetical protein ABR543_06975, partial [Gemmatimonadaceae bacterium]